MAHNIPAIVLVRLESALQWTRGCRGNHTRSVSRCSRRPPSVIAERKPRCRVGHVRGGEAADRSGRSQQAQGIHVDRPAADTNHGARRRNRRRVATQKGVPILAVGRVPALRLRLE